MDKNATWLSKVSDDMNCPKCKEQKVIKNRRTKNNIRQGHYKMRFHRFIENYANQAYRLDINERIVHLTKEGLGIRSTARILEISAAALLKRIVLIARNIGKPIIRSSKAIAF
ncbi:hypothetical protein [uncultured Flavobacterium sp.]|uniref:hypothetical protein n=1 Tax=uncultured Flavobacterium sp. TaxID=165435 RepID=UPI0025DC4784|nr:hypothetical protein [uncultured Flavobacterium sp.]